MYPTNITAFDIETPNGKNDSICSIGIHHVKSDGTTVDIDFIINPEDYFDKRNTGIHRINENMVENAPRFPEIWEDISVYFQDCIVIAHNATFDLSVFFKTLNRYKIDVPDINYVCTLQMARRYLDKGACNGYSLPSLCTYLGIQLDHHNALSDAVACANIYDILTEKYGSDVIQYDKPATLSKEAATLCRKALKTLNGILLGINFDCKLYPEELISFHHWVQDYSQYKGYPDIQICINKIDEVLADALITHDEYNSLLKLTEIDEQKQIFSKTTEAIQQLLGIIEGISCDAKINDIEANRLSDWLLKHDFLNGTYPYDKICSILYKMLEDGQIDSYEESYLLEIIDSILHPAENIDEEDEISYEGSLFCLTGDFAHGSKSQIEVTITERGGQIANSVSKKIQYLIIGDLGSPKWAYGSFGDKVIKARELNDKGARIKILKESELFNVRPVSTGIERFFEELKKIIESHPDYSEGDFEVVENKGFETVYFCDIAVIKTIHMKKENKLEITAKYFDSFGLGEPDDKASWLGITCDDQTLCQIYNGAKEVFKRCYKDSAEFTFGCSNSFVECSDAKKCICKKEHGFNNTKRFSSGCMYKDNLDQGLIFYGENKNYPKKTEY